MGLQQFFFFSLPNLQLTCPNIGIFLSGINYLRLAVSACVHPARLIRVNILNPYDEQMFGSTHEGKSRPNVQERIMHVLRDSFCEERSTRS